MQIRDKISQFLDVDSFKRLDTGKKFAVGGLTALVSLTGIGILAAPFVFKGGVWLSKKFTPMQGGTRESNLAAAVLNMNSSQRKEVEKFLFTQPPSTLFRADGDKHTLDFNSQLIDGDNDEKQIFVYVEGKEDKSMRLKPSEDNPNRYHLILPADEEVVSKWTYTEKQAAGICYLLHYQPEGLETVSIGIAFKDTGFILLQDTKDHRKQFSVNKEGQLQEIKRSEYLKVERAMKDPVAYRKDQELGGRLGQLF